MSDNNKLTVGEQAPDFSITDAAGKSLTLSEYRGNKSVVMVFLRYLGCPICRLALYDLKKDYARFAELDAEVLAFVQSPPERLADAAAEFPFRLIPDEEGKIYNLYGVGSGNLGSMLAPQTVSAALKATFKGHIQGKVEGNTWQLPGDFLVDKDGSLRLARIGKNMGDNLSTDALLGYL
ncbi:MAG TPA: peroxiredoxin-like family protein [bacterium]|nr:peroxiredoxin-like family protein [bacterium]